MPCLPEAQGWKVKPIQRIWNEKRIRNAYQIIGGPAVAEAYQSLTEVIRRERVGRRGGGKES